MEMAYNIFQLLGGVGLFLYGMNVMSTGLRKAAGDKMRQILEKVTSNRVLGVLLGILVTVLIQSSSATDMMVIGFVNSGLMSLIQAIAVIMGANIGTTVTAQITAFNLTDWTPLILFGGAIVYIFFKKSQARHIGGIILGFGMLFVGIWMIKLAVKPLAETDAFKAMLGAISHPVPAVIFGILFTALLQSSSSSIVIFQTFAIEGMLDYHTAVFLVIGAAIGAVTPNLLAGLTTNRDGKRTALLNLVFNLFRAILLILITVLIPAFTNWLQSLSPGDIGRQIANTHTIFAIIAVIVGFPLMNLFVALVKKILPDLPEEKEIAAERSLKYMVNTGASLPAMAVRQAELETIRLGQMARDNLAASLEYFFSKDKDEGLYQRVESREETIDYLTDTISGEIVKLRAKNLTEKETYITSKLLLVLSDFERIGDHAVNVIEYVPRMEQQKTSISEIGSRELRSLGEKSLAVIDLSLQILKEQDFSLLPKLDELEQTVDDYDREISDNHVARLMEKACHPLAGIVYADFCVDLERCADHAVNVAYSLKDAR